MQIVFGTPVNILAVVQRDTLRLDHCKIFRLNEPDEMMSCGFKDHQIYVILRYCYLSEKVQYCLFSTTMRFDLQEVISHFMCDPIEILFKSDELEGTKQFYIDVNREDAN